MTYFWSDVRCFFLISFAVACVAVPQSAGAADDPNALLDKVIAVNKPWLDPSPLQGTYFVSRQLVDAAQPERFGPFQMTNHGNSTNYLYNPGSRLADRVGSLVWTPLHHICHKTSPYTASLEGNTEWNGIPVVAVNVAFGSYIKDQMGFGGQAGMAFNYSECNYPIQWARLLIEPTQAIPLCIETHMDPTNTLQLDVTWQFDTNFLAIDGGLAPRAFTWTSIPDGFRERQVFQSFQNEWVFKRGQAWEGLDRFLGDGQTNLIQTVELVDLSIPFPRLTLQRSMADLVLSWPTYGRAGIILESANSPLGPWSDLPVQPEFTSASPTVSISTIARARFFRLRK